MTNDIQWNVSQTQLFSEQILARLISGTGWPNVNTVPAPSPSSALNFKKKNLFNVNGSQGHLDICDIYMKTWTEKRNCSFSHRFLWSVYVQSGVRYAQKWVFLKIRPPPTHPPTKKKKETKLSLGPVAVRTEKSPSRVLQQSLQGDCSLLRYCSGRKKNSL